ncbi:MAG: triose-phosphate isomerase [Sphingomonadales bacterium]|nr:triose-phosphate isomerase [Sphingomonadales bacterium]
MGDRRKYIVGNWKMNGVADTIDEATAIARHATDAPGVDVALCPPATLVERMARRVPTLAVGGQDCHECESGAYTGSISVAMLVDAGARLVIVGHSERREGLGESDSLVRAKAERALAGGLSVIVCVGESKRIRDAGDAERHVTAQVAASLPEDFDPARLAIAYEPIWAIGTGDVAKVSDVAAMHAAIRDMLRDRAGAEAASVRILYGGSVTGDNAAELLAVADVDGALVGGASLTAAKFVPIVEAAAAIE